MKDPPLELGSNARVKLHRLDPDLDILCSAFEMIASGVTTVQHLDGAQFGSTREVARGIEEVQYVARYRNECRTLLLR